MKKIIGLSACKEVIRDWYDGYRFGDTDVYCPWDVINYCDELLADPSAPPQNYWANTSGNDLIRCLLKKANLTTKMFYELVEDWFRKATRSDASRISRFCAAFPAGDGIIQKIQQSC